MQTNEDAVNDAENSNSQELAPEAILHEAETATSAKTIDPAGTAATDTAGPHETPVTKTVGSGGTTKAPARATVGNEELIQQPGETPRQFRMRVLKAKRAKIDEALAEDAKAEAKRREIEANRVKAALDAKKDSAKFALGGALLLLLADKNVSALDFFEKQLKPKIKTARATGDADLERVEEVIALLGQVPRKPTADWIRLAVDPADIEIVGAMKGARLAKAEKVWIVKDTEDNRKIFKRWLPKAAATNSDGA